MKNGSVSQDRRDFLKKSMSAVAMLAIPSALHSYAAGQDKTNSIVSIVRISNERIDLAVEKAIDLLGGITTVTAGKLIDTNLIIAGTDPLATDMVAAASMGFALHEVPMFSVAHANGMLPRTLDEIEIRGEKLSEVTRTFARATVLPWKNIQNWFGAKEV